MLKRNCCELNMDLVISPVDPILIKSGHTTVSGPSMSFVRTYKNGQEEVFIPGSSLKGVIRSHAEKICRTLNERDDPAVCVPYLTKKNSGPDLKKHVSCGDRLEEYNKRQKKIGNGKPASSNEVYRVSCPICRTFGSTSFLGRFSISDAYVEGEIPVPEPRDGIAIDRFKGSTVQGAIFDMEVVTKGKFKTHITIRNYELWQLGLLSYILQDFKDEIIRIGFGKSRGLGRVKADIEQITVTYYKIPKDDSVPINGLDSFLSEEENQAYGIFTDFPQPSFTFDNRQTRGIRHVYDITEQQNPFLNCVAPVFNRYFGQSNWFRTITDFTNQ